MSGRYPAYYTTLAPFRALFEAGFPILTYHKFGRAPRGARLKGMFLRPELLDRQLRELHGAGFECVTDPGGADPGGAARRVALTIDDGFASVVTLALPILARRRCPAMLYLVADRLGSSNDWEIAQGEVPQPLMSVEQVREWLAAGNRIGAHTLTHPWLTRIPPAEAREEIGASRRKLEDRFGVPVRDFCYPYGDWNLEIRDLVREAGYATAVTTHSGVNGAGSDPWSLRRWTARYASRGWPWIRAWWARMRSQAQRTASRA